MPPKQSKRKEPVHPSRAEDPNKKAAKKARKEAQVKEAMALLSDGKASSSSSGGLTTKKAVKRILKYFLTRTRHAATGQEGKNLLLTFLIHAWEKDKLKDVLKNIPCAAMWYDKNEKANLAKVSTPEVAEKIIDAVKSACPDSAKDMVGEIVAPDGYEQPVIQVVKNDQLTINDELFDHPVKFYVGQMFVLKDCLKSMFGLRYGEIEFGGVTKAAWYVEIKEVNDPAIEDWVEDHGWRVNVTDLRDDGDDDDDDDVDGE